MKAVFQYMQNNPDDKNLVLLNSLSDDSIGEFALLSSGKVVAKSSSSTNWSSVLSCFKENNTTGIFKSDDKDFFAEPLLHQPELVLCGSGHVTLAIIKLAKLIGLSVTAIDDRPFFTDKAKEAGADKVICNDFACALKLVERGQNTFFIVATRGHRYDHVCLDSILPGSFGYLGIMASKTRATIIKRDLKDKNIPQRIIDSIHSPIGISISSETPEEIAVSVIAQVIKHKNQRGLSFGFPDEFLNEYIKFSGFSAALCTIISRRGSSPREVGSKMIVLESGQILNTIGGGCVEAEIRNTALDVISTGKSVIAQKNMTLQEAEEEGMACGGIVDVLIQPIV